MKLPSLAARAVAVLALLCAGQSFAGPTTLGYEGRLANAVGEPVSGTLSITFRLYDVQSSGSPLWTETQGSLQVDGGNLTVELGSVTPLPKSIFGKTLYLGIQIAGDSEMAPRPKLTAAPFALRAESVLRNTVFVPADGSASENGTALLAALTTVAGASAGSPMVVELDAGTYDVGAQAANVPAFVRLAGRGRDSSVITGSISAAGQIVGVVTLASDTSLHALTVRHRGDGATVNDNLVAVRTLPGSARVTIAGVRADARDAAAPTGARIGLLLDQTGDTSVDDVIAETEGGRDGYAVRQSNYTSGVATPVQRSRFRKLVATATGAGQRAGLLISNVLDVDAADLTLSADSNTTSFAIGLSINYNVSGTFRDLTLSAVRSGGTGSIASALDAYCPSGALAFEDFRVRSVSAVAGIVALGVEFFHTGDDPSCPGLGSVPVPTLRDGEINATGADRSQGISVTGYAVDVANVSVRADATGPSLNNIFGIAARRSTVGGTPIEPPQGPLVIRDSEVVQFHNDLTAARGSGLSLQGGDVEVHDTVVRSRGNGINFYGSSPANPVRAYLLVGNKFLAYPLNVGQSAFGVNDNQAITASHNYLTRGVFSAGGGVATCRATTREDLGTFLATGCN